jgi:hypothetical protein
MSDESIRWSVRTQELNRPASKLEGVGDHPKPEDMLVAFNPSEKGRPSRWFGEHRGG